MMHDPRDVRLIEILPSDTRPAAMTNEHVADLSESFYLLFSDVRPLGQRDLAYFHGLLTDFDHLLDVTEELKKFQAWSLDKGDGKLQNPRTRFRGWLRNAVDFRRHDHGANR